MSSRTPRLLGPASALRHLRISLLKKRRETRHRADRLTREELKKTFIDVEGTTRRAANFKSRGRGSSEQSASSPAIARQAPALLRFAGRSEPNRTSGPAQPSTSQTYTPIPRPARAHVSVVFHPTYIVEILCSFLGVSRRWRRRAVVGHRSALVAPGPLF